MKYRDYNERKQHGTYDFPIEYYYVDCRHPQYEMPLHWHREFEFIRILHGEFMLYSGNFEHRLSSGDIMTVDCGVLHRGVPTDCVYECIVCDLGMLQRRSSSDSIGGLLTPIINRRMSVDCLLTNGGLLYDRLSSLFDTMHSQTPYYELEICGVLYTVFASLYREGRVVPSLGNALPDAHTKKLTELTDWIEDNLQYPMTLSQLADRAGFNEKYFCRIFKEFTGHTPIDYVNLLRVDNAARLLIYQKLSVTEAAISSGFSDMSYFSKIFKKYKGMTPSRWRSSAGK